MRSVSFSGSGCHVWGFPQKKSLACSLNFLLSIIGYPLVMALLSPLGAEVDVSSGENIYFTYPLRGFQIAVALWAFYDVRNRPLPKFSGKMFLLAIFWILYFARAFWDLVVSPPYGSSFAWAFSPGRELYFIAYVFIDFIPLLAVLKGWNCIDFPRIQQWLLVLGGIGLLFSLRNLQVQINQSWTGDIGGSGRFAATAMLHTQALGYFGCNMAILAFWTFFNDRRLVLKGGAIFVGLLALYIMLKAGSRGPTFGFIVVVCAWFSVRKKNLFLTLVFGVFVALLVVVFQEQILAIIGHFSSTMEARMRITIEAGDTSGRDVLWREYSQEILKNPILGFQLDTLGSPHSMILDGFMMFGVFAGGIVGLLIFLGCLSVVRALQNQMSNSWWVLFLLMLFTQAFTGGRFSAVALQAPLALLFIFERFSRDMTLTGRNGFCTRNKINMN